MLCKRLIPTLTLILYFVSLLLTSPSFSLTLDYSTLFLWLPCTSSLLIAYLRIFPIVPVSMMFYLRTISDLRMFIVPILPWLIPNTVSVHWKLLVHRVATIHKIWSNALCRFVFACMPTHLHAVTFTYDDWYCFCSKKVGRYLPNTSWTMKWIFFPL